MPIPGRRLLRLTVLCTSAWLVLPAAARAQASDNVLVVVNESSPSSVQIGEYYARKRTIATDHIVLLQAAVTDSVSRADYVKTIEAPIGEWITKNSLQDKVLYIVLTKGVPLRIAGTSGLTGTVSSVDSELTLLYRKMVGTASSTLGRLDNPVFLGEKAIGEAKPFTRFLSDIYLVTRLDGFTVDDVLQLIDRGSAPSREGKIVLDQKSSAADRGGDAWLLQAAERLRAADAGDRVVLEQTTATASAAGPVLGYYSWGSNDPNNQLRRFGFSFANGAIAGMFVSTDGRTFTEPPADWKPSPPSGGPGFGGSFQSLAGDLIRDGVTGISAHVAEPYLDATVRPNILFPAYLAGFNLAESFYFAMPFLSWQTVVVGDPLCAPFRDHPLPAAEVAGGLDPVTELPALFSDRRVAILARSGMNVDALKLTLKLAVQLGRGERENYESILTRAIALEPRLTSATLQLGSLYDEDAKYDKAIEAYRQVIAAEPRNATALNNLAYDLAEHQHDPKEALPVAQKAFGLLPAPVVADTLAWTYHLLGEDAAAAPLAERAVAGAPANADVLMHAAFIHAALDNTKKAAAELELALKANPRLAERPDVKALQTRLSGGGVG
jgi:uncharacterized protein (TIGR03790 family)